VLEAQGVPRWVASRDLRAGDDWVDVIPAGVRSADLVLVLLSTEALSSSWVDRELNWALRSERPLMPVLVGDVKPSDRFEFLFGTIQRAPLPEPPTEEDLTRLADQARAVLGDDRRGRASISHAEPERAPRRPDPFEYRVTSERPAYFVVLVDHSASMNRRLPEYRSTRREAVAHVVNDVLHKLLMASLRSDGFRHYFDVSVCGYGLEAGSEVVRSRLPGDVDRMAAEDLNERWLRLEDEEHVQHLPDGETRRVGMRRPIWMEATPGSGQPAMAEAFEHAGDLVRSWIVDHPESLPPVVMNVCDGSWTGNSPLPAVRELQEQATSLGATVVFNCQLGTSDVKIREQLLYPSSVPAGYGRRTKELFWLSSVLPAPMREEARARGFDVGDKARGFVYNAPVSRVVDFLQIGTQTLT
jgi:hypothetical protein